MSESFTELDANPDYFHELGSPQARREFLHNHLWPVLGTNPVNALSLLMVIPYRDSDEHPLHFTNDLLETFNLIQGEEPIYTPSREQLLRLHRLEFAERLKIYTPGQKGKHKVFQKENTDRTIYAEAFAGAILDFSLTTGLSTRQLFGAEKTTNISSNRFRILSAFLDMDQIVRTEQRFRDMGYSTQHLQQIFDKFVEDGIMDVHPIPEVEYVVQRVPDLSSFRGRNERNVARILAGLKPQYGCVVVTVDKLLARLTTSFPETYQGTDSNLLRARVSYLLQGRLQDDEIVRTKPHLKDPGSKPYLAHQSKVFYTLNEAYAERLPGAIKQLAEAETTIEESDLSTIQDLRLTARSTINNPLAVKRLLRPYVRHIAAKNPRVKKIQEPVRPKPLTQEQAAQRKKQQVVAFLRGSSGATSLEIADVLQLKPREVSSILGHLAGAGVVQGENHNARKGKRWSHVGEEDD